MAKFELLPDEQRAKIRIAARKVALRDFAMVDSKTYRDTGALNEFADGFAEGYLQAMEHAVQSIKTFEKVSDAI